MPKELGDDRTRTADVNWIKKYSITVRHDVKKNMKNIWELPGGTAIAQGLAGHQLVGNEQLLVHYLFYIYVLYIGSIYYYHDFFLIFLFCPSEYFYFNPIYFNLLCCFLSCFFLFSPLSH